MYTTEVDRSSAPDRTTTREQRALEQVILELRELVEMRSLLESRHAPAAQLELHEAEIQRLRTRLARLVKEGRSAQ